MARSAATTASPTAASAAIAIPARAFRIATLVPRRVLHDGYAHGRGPGTARLSLARRAATAASLTCRAAQCSSLQRDLFQTIPAPCSPAIRTTTRSRRCSSAQRVTPMAGARAPARRAGRRPTPYVSYGRGRRSIRRRSSACDISPVRLRRRWRNFARWYAFSRTRILAMKTAGGIAFFDVARRQCARRIQYLEYVCNASFSTSSLSTGPEQDGWFDEFLFGDTRPAKRRRSMRCGALGNTFRTRGTAAGLPGATDPLDPVTAASASQNYHLLATDGYFNDAWNDIMPARSGLVGPIGTGPDGACPVCLAQSRLHTRRRPFPPPITKGRRTTSNTLADLAMNYWISDLRPLYRIS